jgi:phenylalanyl-tRNA synthetase alpha subunit
MGFEEMPTNSYVENSFWNFDALFQPQQHPARDAHDTFFLTRKLSMPHLPVASIWTLLCILAGMSQQLLPGTPDPRHSLLTDSIACYRAGIDSDREAAKGLCRPGAADA